MILEWVPRIPPPPAGIDSLTTGGTNNGTNNELSKDLLCEKPKDIDVNALRYMVARKDYRCLICSKFVKKNSFHMHQVIYRGKGPKPNVIGSKYGKYKKGGDYKYQGKGIICGCGRRTKVGSSCRHDEDD